MSDAAFILLHSASRECNDFRASRGWARGLSGEEKEKTGTLNRKILKSTYSPGPDLKAKKKNENLVIFVSSVVLNIKSKQKFIHCPVLVLSRRFKLQTKDCSETLSVDSLFFHGTKYHVLIFGQEA